MCKIVQSVYHILILVEICFRFFGYIHPSHVLTLLTVSKYKSFSKNTAKNVGSNSTYLCIMGVSNIHPLPNTRVNPVTVSAALMRYIYIFYAFMFISYKTHGTNKTHSKKNVDCRKHHVRKRRRAD